MIHKKEKRDKRAEEEDNYIPKAFQKNKRKEKNNEVEKDNKGNNKKGKTSKKKLKKRLLISCLIIIIIIGIILGIRSHRWKTLAQEMLANKNSIVIDIDGKEIAKLGCEKKNLSISLDNIPNDLKNAYVAIEDERFYSHGGIDIKRTCRRNGFLYCSFWEVFLWWQHYYTTTGKKLNR